MPSTPVPSCVTVETLNRPLIVSFSIKIFIVHCIPTRYDITAKRSFQLQSSEISQFLQLTPVLHAFSDHSTCSHSTCDTLARTRNHLQSDDVARLPIYLYIYIYRFFRFCIYIYIYFHSILCIEISGPADQLCEVFIVCCRLLSLWSTSSRGTSGDDCCIQSGIELEFPDRSCRPPMSSMMFLVTHSSALPIISSPRMISSIVGEYRLMYVHELY